MTLGGLFSCVAKQLQVEIKFNEPYAITHVHSIYSHTPENFPCERVKFKLNDLNAAEKRNLIFQLHIPEIEVNETMSMDDENAERQDGQAADMPQIIGKTTSFRITKFQLHCILKVKCQLHMWIQIRIRH